jgi:hypothetical protein
MKIYMLAASAAAILALCANPAFAANVNFHDLTENGTTVDATQFDVSGPSIVHKNIFGGEDDVEVTGQFFTDSPDGSGGNLTGLLEPGTARGGFASVSDFISSNWTVINGIATITLDFGSDPSTCNEPGTPPCNTRPLSFGIFENGTLQNVNGILSLPDNITVQIASDTGVPEPLTLSLFAVGLAGAGALRRRRKSV